MMVTKVLLGLSCLIAPSPFARDGLGFATADGTDVLDGWRRVPGCLEKRIAPEQVISCLALAPILYAGSWSAFTTTDAYVSDYCPRVVIELHCRVDGSADWVRLYVDSFKIRWRQKGEPRLPFPR
jgi:hypothetical protein